jgi:hypothetical protein
LSSGKDYKLGVNLRGGLVNVSLNGAVVMSNLYNETITIGGYGLISMQGAASGQTSFDIVRLQTDDAAYPPQFMLAVAAPAQPVTSQGPISATDLAAIETEAKHRLALAGLDAASLSRLDEMSVQFADLNGLALGEYLGDTIIIDTDAAGYGWFIDLTPGDDSEFLSDGGVLTASAAPAAGHMDLLTVMAHELGHAAGLSDNTGPSVMSETLAAGDRLVTPAPQTEQTGGVFAGLLNSLKKSWFANETTRNMDTMQSESPVINWDSKFFGSEEKGDKPERVADKPRWAIDFVNYLGQNEAQRNPNANLRVHISAGTEVSPELVE